MSENTTPPPDSLEEEFRALNKNLNSFEIELAALRAAGASNVSPEELEKLCTAQKRYAKLRGGNVEAAVLDAHQRIELERIEQKKNGSTKLPHQSNGKTATTSSTIQKAG